MADDQDLDKSDSSSEPNISPEEVHRQQYGYFTSMSNLLFTIPIGFATIIGGIWYLASSVIPRSELLAALLFLFAFLCSIAFANMMHRFGAAYSAYISNLNALDGQFRVTIKHLKTPSTVRTVIYLLLSFGVLSFLGAAFALFGVFDASPVAPENS